MLDRKKQISYSISQVEALTGVTKATIRYWEKIFPKFVTPLRRASGQRRYRKGDVNAIRRINFLVNERKLHADGVLVALGSRQPTEDDIAWIMSEIKRLASELKDLSQTLTKPLPNKATS